jgi:hypothetical protein
MMSGVGLYRSARMWWPVDVVRTWTVASTFQLQNLSRAPSGAASALVHYSDQAAVSTCMYARVYTVAGTTWFY